MTEETAQPKRRKGPKDIPATVGVKGRVGGDDAQPAVAAPAREPSEADRRADYEAKKPDRRGCKRLGWTEIPVVPLDVDDDAAELAEIDENLARSDLQHAERLDLAIRRAKIVERIEAKAMVSDSGTPIKKQRGRNAGVAGLKSGSQRDVAKKTGTSKSTLNRAKAVEKAFGENTVGELVNTSLSSAREIAALVKLPEAERKELVKKAIAVEQVSTRKEREIKARPRRADGHVDWRPDAPKEFVKWRKCWSGIVPELKSVEKSMAAIEHALTPRQVMHPTSSRPRSRTDAVAGSVAAPATCIWPAGRYPGGRRD